jgi:ferredoxin
MRTEGHSRRPYSAHIAYDSRDFVVRDMTIERIRIEEGCISCNLCQDLCPEVFEVPLGEFCVVKSDAAARWAGDSALSAKIQEAADSCPVEVIKLDGD